MLMARLAGAHQVLAPVLDPLHRRGHLQCGEHDAHLVAHDHDLLAEATAGVAHDDADPVLRDSEQPRREGPHLVGSLRRGIDGDLAVPAVVVDHDAAGLHRARGLRLLIHRQGDDVGGRGEHLLDRRSRRAGHAPDEVAAVGGVHEVGRFGGGEEVDDRGQGLVVDHDHVGGVLGDVAVLRQHQRDGIAGEAHLALRERRARRVVRDGTEQRVPLLVHAGVEVLGDEDGVHAVECSGIGCVDVDDAGAACGLRTKHAWSMPGSWMSSTNVPCPVSSRGSSTRCTRLPAYRVAARVGVSVMSR